MSKTAGREKLSVRAESRKRRAREAREVLWAPPAPVVLIDRGTSVTPRKSHQIPDEWWPAIDAEWHRRHIGSARRWQERGRRLGKEARRKDRLNQAWAAESGRGAPVVDAWTPRRGAWYAAARARTMAVGRSELVQSCGTRSMQLRCTCGPSRKKIGCGQILICDECRRPYYRRIRRRALSAVTARLADATTVWAADGRRRGHRPQIVMLTLTVPRHRHGVALTLAQRADILITGWRRLRQWLHGKIGKFHYVALPEITAGSDGAGHLHYHVLAVWPFWDWTDAQGEWRRATGLADANAPHMRVVRNVRTAAHYVAKYATKGANVDDESMTPELLADFVATFYGRRKVCPSVGWWVPQAPPVCPCCASPLIVTERPGSAVDAAAAWRARRRLAAIDPWAPRREQKQLTWVPE